MDIKEQKILNQRLREMVRQEYEAFRQTVLGKSPQEIYDMTREIAVKEEAAALIFNTEFPAETADAMLKAGKVLQKIYEETDGLSWERLLIHAMTSYRQSVVKRDRSQLEIER